MPHRRLLQRTRAMQVAQHVQLAVLKTHVRPEPIRPVLRLALVAFRRARRRKGGFGRKMGLADKTGLITRARQRAREAGLAHARIEIDAVVPHTVRQRQQAGEYRRTRRLAHQIRRDAGGETRALLRKPVDMRRLDVFVFETVAVGALLVGGDEQDVGA